jgi:tetratricopeptide (TPR) repeat protein
MEREPHSASVLAAMALVEQQRSGTEGALAYLMRALEEDPDYPPALYNLGLLYQEQFGDGQSAASYYEKFLAVAPDGAYKDAARAAYEALLLSGADRPQPSGAEPGEKTPARSVKELLGDARAVAKRGDTKAALQLCQAAAEQAKQQRDKSRLEQALRTGIELCPEEADAHYAWGRYCLDEARFTDALTGFKRARLLDPRRIDAYLGLSEAAAETGEFDAALVTLKQAIRLAPDNADVQWALAGLYDHHLGLTEQAIRTYRDFEQRFTADPRIVQAKERLPALEAILKEKRREAEAETTAGASTPGPETGPASEPEPEPVVELRRPRVRNTSAAVQAYNRGTSYQERQDWDRAIYYYRRAIENDSTFANAYYNLGTAYRAQRALGLAKDAYLHAVQLQPRMVNARYNLALVYMELNMNSAAIEQLRAVLRLQPNHALSHYVLGLLYSRSPQARNLTRRHYERFLELAPNDRSAATARAWLRSNP